MLADLAAPFRLTRFILFCWILSGCGSPTSPSESNAGRMVYVDTATMQPLVHDVATSFPAMHPKTGQPTLRPGLYCPTCKKWYPAPDFDLINRVPGSGLCPQDKTALTTDGPWPDGFRPSTKSVQ